MINLSLVGKKAVVCGASQGIGKAIAIELAQLGASCILLSRNEDTLRSTCSMLKTEDGQDHQFHSVDFNDRNKLEELIISIAKNNSAEILINNTGGPSAGMIVDASEHDFESAFSQHLICNHILAKHLIPGMKQKGYGRIINVISTSVRIPLDNLGVSNTIRAAVASWSKTMSNELAQYGITVNSLLPGFIATDRLDAVATHFSVKAKVEKGEMIERMKASVPAKRFGEPSEIAAVAAFLASPAASYVNGVSIPVDGGRTGTI